jgi:ribosomal protein S10
MPLQPIYETVPDDFGAFVLEVNKAFNNQWAPRSAFEEIFNYFFDRNPRQKRQVAELRKGKSEDYMTTYMLDMIEDSALNFIQSLGPKWTPLLKILQNMSVNERRSFCCKILYQRMKEMHLEELARKANQPTPFRRETETLTPEQEEKLEEKRLWEEHLPEDVRDAYLAPKKLYAPYGIKCAQIQIRGWYRPPVEFMADFCVRAAYYFGLPCTGPVPLPRKIERWTTIRSPFIYKKQQEVFERRTFARLVTVKDGHPDVVEMWLSYCVRNQFFGTGMKAHLFSYDYVGVGKTMEKDIKDLIEHDRWSVDGYNMLQDDASVLKRTIDNEIARIESQIASRDNLDRATKILQNRVSELLHLEGEAEKEADTEVQEEAQKQLWAPPKSREEAEEQKDRKRRMRDRARRGALGSLVKQLPEMELEDLDDEVTFDRQQVEALQKHLLHVGMYAQQKGVAPLTREEYFVYVPHVLLPKYEEIPEDIFDDLEEKGLLRVPKDDTGYLADWYEMDDQERHDAVVWYRQERPEEEEGWQGDKVDTSRFEEILVRRRAVRSPGILLDPVLMEGEEELLEDGEDPATDSSRQKSVRSGDADALLKTSKQKGDESVESPDDSTDKDSKS